MRDCLTHPCCPCAQLASGNVLSFTNSLKFGLDQVWNKYLLLYQDHVQRISLEDGSNFRKAAQRNATLLNQANIGFLTPSLFVGQKIFVLRFWLNRFFKHASSFMLSLGHLQG